MEKDEVRQLVDELIELKNELNECEDMLEARHPGLMKRMQEIRKEIPSIQSRIKDGIRSWGPGNHEFPGGNFIRVNKAPTKVTVDMEGLIERAEERGDIEALLEAEVLTYNVNVHQIERLDGTMKAIYKGYLEETEGTPAVSLPSQLK